MVFVFFKQKTAYDMLRSLVGSEMCIRDSRYALGIPGVDTVVLGVKNREELRECLAAATAGPLSLIHI